VTEAEIQRMKADQLAPKNALAVGWHSTTVGVLLPLPETGRHKGGAGRPHLAAPRGPPRCGVH
jgi:hypothetical protein